ncbi:PTS transporter subunit EIIC [Enterococcus casseliflavus]|uniref:PTS transporter subunit EIIC n=1 Tax=Enterococcus casseliflavus TaxID=37734 RepID=UPI001432A3B1|nr:PTS transporter subunit EIIC [Enterococcus casseliflavus]NKD30971.1 PTS transporter subunit EIIC [Enterococcus casseliflavus]NKD34163.1 PTS transporter subunit EIIC [Enterococcus casseliflavus]
MKHQEMCAEILEAIGKENILDVFNCVTRLRIVVKDKKLVDFEKLEHIKGIIQVKTLGNQVQCVIGPQVEEVCMDFKEMIGFKGGSSTEEKQQHDQEQPKGVNGILQTLSSIFMPLIPLFCTGGMIKSLTIILSTFNLTSEGSGLLTVLEMIGDAPFYFLPFMVAYTTAKRFKLNELLGLMVAGILMYPTMLEQAGKSVKFILFDIPYYNYASTVLPAILCVIAMSYIYHFVNRFVPKNLSLVFTGMISFALFMPILLFVIAPLGNYCTGIVSTFFLKLFDIAGPVAGALFAGFMPFLVMTGMHSALDPVIIQNFATTGMDYLFPAFFVSNIAIGGATLATSLKIKDKEMKAATFSNGGLCILGITEPAIYSVCVKYRHALIGSILGGAVGGAVYMLFSVQSLAFAMPGLFSIVSYMDGANNLLWMVLSLVLSFITAFGYTFAFTKKTDSDSEDIREMEASID